MLREIVEKRCFDGPVLEALKASNYKIVDVQKCKQVTFILKSKNLHNGKKELEEFAKSLFGLNYMERIIDIKEKGDAQGTILATISLTW